MMARKPAPAAPQQRPASTSASAPAPVHQQSSVPAPQSSGGGSFLGDIGSTIAQGMAFGTGSAIAHRAVGAVANSFGGGSSNEVQQAAPSAVPQQQMTQQQFQGACGQNKQMFYECLDMNKGDQQACTFLYDQLMQCQQSQPQFG